MDIQSAFAALKYNQTRPATEPQRVDGAGGFEKIATDFAQTLAGGEFYGQGRRRRPGRRYVAGSGAGSDGTGR